jgi:hypothetical protein
MEHVESPGEHRAGHVLVALLLVILAAWLASAVVIGS